MTTISVSSLGPIRRAEIDPDHRLLIFHGPDTTGKGLAASVVFGLFRRFHQGLVDWPADVVPGSVCEPLVRDHTLTLKLSEVYGMFAPAVLRGLSRDLQGQLSTVFGSSYSRLDAAEVSVSDLKNPRERSHLYPLPVTLSRMADGISLKTHMMWKDDVLRFSLGGKRDPAARPHVVRRLVCGVLAEFVVWSVSGMMRPMIFPVERLGFAVFGRDIPLLQFDSGSEGNIYSLAIHEHSRLFESLPGYLDELGELADLADLVERAILHGKVRLSDVKELEFVPDGAPPMEMHLAGSAVKSLGTLVLYLRYLARDNDFLIIEDPEMNLLPETRRVLARILAKAVNRGMKVLISTHSQEICSEISDLVLIGAGHPKAERLRRRFAYSDDEILCPSDVAVYQFQSDRVDRIPVEKSGFVV